jgi:multicomponent Na+:H+ antiporter subunit D
MDLALNLLGLLTPVLIIHAFAIPIAKIVGSRKLQHALALSASLFGVLSTTMVLDKVYREGPIVYLYGGWPPHFGIVYEVDSLNALIGLLTAWIMLAIVVYSYWYRHHLDDPTWYYTLLIGLETGLIGCLYTGDAFNLFVMIEVLSISAYGLVAYHRDRAEAIEAAAKYALIGAVATTFYFTAVVLLYAGYGSVNMGVLAYATRPWLLFSSPLVRVPDTLKYLSLLSIALSLWVFTYKSALFPNHFWLPDAHPEAPTPVSAALSGLVVNVGVYATARFLYTIFGENSALGEYRSIVMFALFLLGVVSGFIGALMMMRQDDIKRLLAYSTISHMGIAYMGISAGFLTGNDTAVKYAVAGGVIHVVAHSIAKSMLFMASGVFIDAAGSRNLDDIKGVGRHYPLASASMILGFLSLAGFIPLIGFYSKWYIAQGYLNAGSALVPVLLIALSALSLPGYLKVISAVLFSTGGRQTGLIKEKWVEYLLFGMALSLIALGVVFQYTWSIYESASNALVNGYNVYLERTLENMPPDLRSFIYNELIRAYAGVKP